MDENHSAQADKTALGTQQTRKFREQFGFFGMVSFLYAVLYAFCMYKNGSGITFLYFIAASLMYFYCAMEKLEIALKKGSIFYMISMALLAVSTFCTDDARLVWFNKAGIFLLTMSLLLKQCYDTSKWKLGKYLKSIAGMVMALFARLGRPFADGREYHKNNQDKKNQKLWYVGIGLAVAIPLLLLVMALLSSADAVFRQMTQRLWKEINLWNLMNVIFRIAFIFFFSYTLLAYLCEHCIDENVRDRRTGEPLIAITVTFLLSLMYLLFSGIQILYLFIGKMQLPEGYTYAGYAREGFFQLLAVSILNLIIVLVCLSFFRESRVLKIILTVMSLCTFVMIASSAMRMIIYISCYDLTFLRVLVLWALAVLALLFAGVIVNIYKDGFRLFGYSVIVVTVMYLALSFAHPDYMIAKVNTAKAESQGRADYTYLCGLSADAAPALIGFMERQGYDFAPVEVFREGGTQENENLYWQKVQGKMRAESGQEYAVGKHLRDSFGYFYMLELLKKGEKLNVRTFNVSRYRAYCRVRR